MKPTILSLTPDHGAAGATVTINGKTFTGTTSVTFNGVRDPFTLGDDALTAKVPAAATKGPIAVTNAGGTDTTDDSSSTPP